jgi:putative transcriptional regulator|nr:MAG TPA: Cro/C1-type HTH DNA-binding domain protein [Caudoviricetes sp.]
MPIKYKFNVLSALKNKGFSTYRIRQDKLLSESTVQKLRNEEPVSWENLETICKLLECQPGDIIEYVEE